MDPKRSEDYEAIPYQCFACAAKDAEVRRANEARKGDMLSPASFDGLHISVVRKGEIDG